MKIRELEKMLLDAGFKKRTGKGSHRNYKKGQYTVTISGKANGEAKQYQIKQVREAINESN